MTLASTTSIDNSPDDTQLVERSLGGDTKAFGSLVERHQSLVCGLAYSACGNVQVSEDLAQETFIAAWRQLRTLREKAKLRGWLCGIARKVIQNFLRQQQHTPTAAAYALEDMVETSSAEPSPAERAISEQEAAILWRTLQSLPPNYREPMVLYYRQDQSVTAVAECLGLSEDAVKQRLARGRAMLAEQVEQLLGNTLRQTAPTGVFTSCVLAAIPLAATSASAATTGATLAKGGGAGAKTVTLAAGSAMLGGLLALAGTWVGYKVSMDCAKSPEERLLIRKLYRMVAMCCALLGVALVVLVLSGKWLSIEHPSFFAALLIGLNGVCLSVGIGAILWAGSQNRTLPQREEKGESAAALPLGQWGVPLLEYRSKLSLLGLPLVHLRFGRKRGEPVRPVRAWFAAGDFAIGVVGAFGAMTIAPISVGACSLGLLSFGGLAAGVACWGGIGLGVWAIGGCAMGWAAFGGCVAGWHTAEGALVAAHDFALGYAAAAHHTNDAVAKAALNQMAFYRIARPAMDYAVAINLVWILPLLLMWRKARPMKSRNK